MKSLIFLFVMILTIVVSGHRLKLYNLETVIINSITNIRITVSKILVSLVVIIILLFTVSCNDKETIDPTNLKGCLYGDVFIIPYREPVQHVFISCITQIEFEAGDYSNTGWTNSPDWSNLRFEHCDSCN